MGFFTFKNTQCAKCKCFFRRHQTSETLLFNGIYGYACLDCFDEELEKWKAEQKKLHNKKGLKEGL